MTPIVYALVPTIVGAAMLIGLNDSGKKGVLLFGPPGTGKTLCARAVANRTDATFIRVIGSELVQKYVGEGARMVRELFEMARSKKACIIFFDEVDAIGGARFDDGAGGDNEVQRTYTRQSSLSEYGELPRTKCTSMCLDDLKSLGPLSGNRRERSLSSPP